MAGFLEEGDEGAGILESWNPGILEAPASRKPRQTIIPKTIAPP